MSMILIFGIFHTDNVIHEEKSKLAQMHPHDSRKCQLQPSKAMSPLRGFVIILKNIKREETLQGFFSFYIMIF